VVAVVLIPLFVGVLAVETGGGLAQTGFLWANELLNPDFTRINPITGFQRLFSLDTAAELLKTLLCILGIGVVGVVFLYARVEALSGLVSLDARAIALYASRQGVHLLELSVGVLTVIAVFDYFLQRWRTESQLRMSRQEIKEEMREHDGDPQVKNRLKSIRMKMARQRMMADVPKADVVITNPEELAVALRYHAQEMGAPRVVAKGAGHIARQIRSVARAHGIPIAENKPVARLLYRTVEVGKEIPENLYRTVAEVLAYVYRLRRGRTNEETDNKQ
jgi:flagellar biosynthetic protein FlhB